MKSEPTIGSPLTGRQHLARRSGTSETPSTRIPNLAALPPGRRSGGARGPDRGDVGDRRRAAELEVEEASLRIAGHDPVERRVLERLDADELVVGGGVRDAPDRFEMALNALAEQAL